MPFPHHIQRGMASKVTQTQDHILILILLGITLTTVILGPIITTTQCHVPTTVTPGLISIIIFKGHVFIRGTQSLLISIIQSTSLFLGLRTQPIMSQWVLKSIRCLTTPNLGQMGTFKFQFLKGQSP